MHFIKTFVKEPIALGAVTPSSRHLAHTITETADVRHAGVVVEFGPGTGVVTEAIVDQLPEKSPFITIEVVGDFVPLLRKRFPNVDVIHDSAVNVLDHLQDKGLDSCDCVVSGLPFAGFEPQLQDELLDAAYRALRPGGRFVTFTYITSPFLAGGKRFRRALEDKFGTVKKSRMTWCNFPPAFCYLCEKRSDSDGEDS